MLHEIASHSDCDPSSIEVRVVSLRIKRRAIDIAVVNPTTGFHLQEIRTEPMKRKAF